MGKLDLALSLSLSLYAAVSPKSKGILLGTFGTPYGFCWDLEAPFFTFRGPHD